LAFSLEYLLYLRVDRSWWKLQWRKQLPAACATYVVFVVVSLACLIPSRHVGYRTTGGGGLVGVESSDGHTRSRRRERRHRGFRPITTTKRRWREHPTPRPPNHLYKSQS